jgi:hypothetical protein
MDLNRRYITTSLGMLQINHQQDEYVLTSDMVAESYNRTCKFDDSHGPHGSRDGYQYEGFFAYSYSKLRQAKIVGCKPTITQKFGIYR